MSRFVKESDVKQVLESLVAELGELPVKKAVDLISLLPSAELEAPVQKWIGTGVEGKWIKTSTKSDRCMCSRCHTYFNSKDLPMSNMSYCPNCGAYMKK